MSIGKNVIRTTTAAFDGHSKPNHITMIGATATSGIALVSEASGSRPRCRNGRRSMATPTAKPSAEPSAQPTRTDLSTVWTKSRLRVSHCASIDCTIADGAGRRTRGTSKAVTPTCQKNSTHRPNSADVSVP